MRVIDCRTGKELYVGDILDLSGSVKDINGNEIDQITEKYEILEIHPGIFNASVRARFIYNGHGHSIDEIQKIPLAVHWFHPSFFLQHIGFLPT